MSVPFALTIILEKGKKYWIASCPEVPEANGQGMTREKAIADLKKAIMLVIGMQQGEGFRFSVIIEQDDDWYIGHCPEIPGSHGQGKTKEECLDSVKEAILLIFEDRREDALKNVPPNAICETLTLA